MRPDCLCPAARIDARVSSIKGSSTMKSLFNRRGFLSHSAALGGSMLTCSFALDRSATAAPERIDAPVVDEVTVREITDNTHDIFLRGEKLPGLAVARTGMPEASRGKTLESEWGLARS